MQYCPPRSDDLSLRQLASRSPEIAHSCLLRFEEPHCIDELCRVRRSGANSTLGLGDLCQGGTGPSLQVPETIYRGVERAQLSG